MFQSARLKLTAWYLVIILCISFAFSAVIYAFLSREVERFAKVQRLRIERQRTPFGFIPQPEQISIALDPDLIAETKHRILYTLVVINGCIMVIAGGLGYILAGRTLSPIQKMVDEQYRFVQDASHELRTPLTSLKSALEVSLRDKKATLGELKMIIRDAIGDTNKLQALTDALLKLAQYEKPEIHIVHEPVDLQSVISAASASVKAVAKQKKITIKMPTDSCIVKGHEQSITEVFIILLENAIKYSNPKSTITIDVIKKDQHAYISVADHGLGISEEDLPHIFKRFYRADSARTKSDQSGYGLGLSIAKHLVSLNNGTITVESTPESGSVFTVILPV